MSLHSKTLFSSILTISLLLGLVPARAWAVTQEEINSARERRDAIRAERREKQASVDALTQEQAGVLERKAAMDARSASTQEQIRATQDEIELYRQRIEEKTAELAEAREREVDQLARYRGRVRYMEEEGKLNLLSLVLHTESVHEFLTALDDVGEIMQYDRELEDAYIAARKHTELVRSELEQTQTDLLERCTELETEESELEEEIEEASELIRSLQSDIESHETELAEIQAAEWSADQELQQLMAELERQRQAELERQRQEEERRRREAEEQRKAAEEQQRQAEEEARQREAAQVVGTGTFTWPVPGHTYVTSRFGLRTHPITGVRKSHTGIDISADNGTAIVAADGATVTKAAVYSGYGNCVILDHGNGYVTLYGHLSAFAVSEGDAVSRGQTIGYVGSTGFSTGPHCHFEIWSNGGRIDPESFFSGLTFSPAAGE